MAAFFEEMEALDRPTVDVKIKIKDREFNLVARKPSYEEQDAIDQFQTTELRRLLKRANEPDSTSGVSERDRLIQVYTSRPKHDIVTQLLPVYAMEIREIAAEKAGINVGIETLKMQDMKGEEREAYAKEKEAELEPFVKEATEEIRKRLSDMDKAELVEQLVEMNLNLRMNMEARRTLDCELLHKVAQRREEDGTLTQWPSPEETRKHLRPETISEIADAVRSALFAPQRPLESPAPNATEEQSSSSASSAAVESEKSGDSTEETQTA